MRDAVERVRKLAAEGMPILIVGEPGTCKELVAREAHRWSRHHDGELVTLRCTHATARELDAALSGATRSAPAADEGAPAADANPPATARRPRRFTLLLDEIGDLPLELQPKLLRALASRDGDAGGAADAPRFDFQLVATTHRDLSDSVRRGELRADLHARLLGAAVTLPPLRDRPGDVGPLARTFLRRAAARAGRTRAPEFAPEALAALERHHWPGNVRELERLMQVLVATVAAEALYVEHVRSELAPTARSGEYLREHRDGARARSGRGRSVALELFEAERMLVVKGRSVLLTPLELGILRCVAEAEGRTVPLDFIGYQAWFTDKPRKFRSHVCTLRKKLGPFARALETVRGEGLRFEAPPDFIWHRSGKGR